MAQCEAWLHIKDIIGPDLSRWPRGMPNLFWTSELNHKQRFKISCFVWVNGLDPVLFLEWCDLADLLRDDQALRHVKYLFRKFESGDWNKKYWQWNVAMNCDQYLGGEPHYY